MTIVCGTDFSSWSKSSLRAAAALASRLGHALWVVHVLDATQDATAIEPLGPLHQRLDAEAKSVATRGLIVNTEVLRGHRVDTLAQFARVKKAALVVVGSRGHATSPMVQLGGTSERLAHGTETPVLVVRDGDSFEAWAQGTPLKVVVGVDATLSCEAAVRWVEKLRQVGPVDVVLGHIYYPGEAAEALGLTRRVAPNRPDPALETLLTADLSRRFSKLSGHGSVDIRVQLGLGRAGDHLVELAERVGAQLVVVGAHGRSGPSRLWSVSAVVLHVSRAAVAVVPNDATASAHAAQPALSRVLACTDFSEVANAAVPWAYQLVAPGGEVTLVHVMPANAESAKASREAAAALHALVPIGHTHRAVTRTEVLFSDAPAEAIVDAAARAGVDAVVLASHGRGALMRSVLGSVADGVLRATTRPVFVVKPKV